MSFDAYRRFVAVRGSDDPSISLREVATAVNASPAPSAPPGVEHSAPSAGPVAAPLVVPMALTAHPYRPNALNFSVIGIVIGKQRLTYERLLRPKHGLYVEGIVAPDVLNGFDFVGYGGGMGYRFHWSGPGTSGFVGAGVTLLRYRGRGSPCPPSQRSHPPSSRSCAPPSRGTPCARGRLRLVVRRRGRGARRPLTRRTHVAHDHSASVKCAVFNTFPFTSSSSVCLPAR
ncbi:MAG: hypothetical protein RL385_902, partial [Pseudomonadota bacterium]